MPVNPIQHLGALRGVKGRRSAVAALVVLVALSSVLVGCQARPRTIVMEDFESGAITNWQAVGGGSGGWFAYSNGHKPPDPAQSDPNAPFDDYGVKWPKAVAKVVDDARELLCFYDFPAEHWVHLKTSNPIESTFSSVRLRTRVTKGPGSKAAGLAMAFKLLEAAQDRWRAVNGPHLVALVRAGARFDKGVMVERPDETQEVAAWS
jgi:hypothetical protein